MFCTTYYIMIYLEERDLALQKLRDHAKTCLTKEPGCLLFDVWLSDDDPTKLYVYIIFADTAAFELHVATVHFNRMFMEFRALTADYALHKWPRRIPEADPAQERETTGRALAEKLPENAGQMLCEAVYLTVRTEHREAFIALMKQQAEDCLRRAPGWMSFDLWLDDERPEQALLYAVYESRAAFEAHAARLPLARLAAEHGEVFEIDRHLTWNRLL